MHQAQGAEWWARLRALVAEADHVLTSNVYAEIQQAFADWMSDPTHPEHPQQLGAKATEPEFLTCVDRAGTPAPLDAGVVEDFEQMASRYPGFKTWFRPATVAEGKPSTLFVARWVCHLLGFRHRAVHLFIDHPASEDYALVQVRGLRKIQYPGCFGVPVAGHIVESASATQSVLEELREELCLGRDDIDDLRKIGAYEHQDAVAQHGVRNIEFRIVFRARLKRHSLGDLRPANAEVAAIAIFSLSQLEALTEAFPDRVSSGLRASLPIYLRSRDAR